VYEFREAHQEYYAQWKKGDAIEDMPEQALIALFGLPVLLNQDIGGFGYTCLEDNSQRPLFQLLQTNIIADKYCHHYGSPASNTLQVARPARKLGR
jgi:hypothetical protein